MNRMALDCKNPQGVQGDQSAFLCMGLMNQLRTLPNLETILLFLGLDRDVAQSGSALV